jgi:alkanesulfonate monooxygenase SsuD/methylene tetrahydromethanopterin reductase-like flavin-dependent oxidoreductase (luciferase family)
MDYGRPVQFGYFLTPDASDYPEVLRRAQLCDVLGMELIGIQDHPYQSRFLDTWTLITALAAQTNNVRLFPDVVSLPLRPPAVLAKSAATLDILSGGRIELGLGAGAFWTAIGAMGGPVRTPGEAVAAVEDAINVIRLMWSGSRGVRYDGKHYSLKGVHSGPVPAHPMSTWIGAIGPEMQKRIDDAALNAGRDPAAIRRLYNVMGQIGDGPSKVPFNGPITQWVDELTRLALVEGMDTFILGLPEPPGNQIERFMAEIAPRVRENVAAARR